MLFSQVDRLGRLLTHSVMPLYIESRDWKGVVGSAFFVRCQGRFFLVTAAHVLAPHLADQSLYYYISPTVTRTVTGRASMTSPDGGEEDQLDVAVVELEGDGLPPYPAVQRLALELLQCQSKSLPRSGAQYLLIGYPSSKNELHRVRREFVAKTYAFHGDSAEPARYAARHLSEETHLLIKFDPMAGIGAEDKPTRFPKPQGMSGGPVFRVDLSHSPNAYANGFPVVAIATAHRAGQKLIQCTDISVALSLIGQLLAR